jgi:nucleoside-diphosphate-sugar epimerase
VFGSGIGMRDWTHVSDAAEGILFASENQLTMDIGTGRLTSIRDAVELLHREMLSESKVVFDPEKDRPDTQIKIKAKLGAWKPKINLENGIKELAATQ